MARTKHGEARDPWFPKPWRVEEDWTVEVLDAEGRCVMKLPLQRLAEARAIVDAVNAPVVEPSLLKGPPLSLWVQRTTTC